MYPRIAVLAAFTTMITNSFVAQDVGGGSPGDNCEDVDAISIVTLAPVAIAHIQSSNTIVLEQAPPTWLTSGQTVKIADCLNASNNIDRYVSSVNGNTLTITGSLVPESSSPGVLYGKEGRIFDIWRAHHPSDDLPNVVMLQLYDFRLKVSNTPATTFTIQHEGSTIRGTWITIDLTRFATLKSLALLLHEFTHALQLAVNSYFYSFVGTATAVGAGFITDANADHSKVELQRYISFKKTNGSIQSTPLTGVNVTTHTVYFASQYVPLANTTYSIDTGLGYAHWDDFFNVGGSYVHGGNWTDNGNGTFTQGPRYDKWSTYDFHAFGLKPLAELTGNFQIVNPVPPQVNSGSTVSGTRVDWTVPQIFGTSGVPQFTNHRNNYHVRWVIATTVEHPVNGEIVDNHEELRKRLSHYFQTQSAGPPPASELRGSITSLPSTSLPDLLIVDAFDAAGNPPLRAGPGQALSLKAMVHNQSSIAATPPGGIPITTRTLPGPTWVQSTYTATKVDPFEIEAATFNFNVPSETLLFGSNNYRGSFGVRFKADDPGSVGEGDELHNIRDIPVGWAPALSVNVPLGGTPTTGPVSGGPRFYVGYQVGSQHRLGEIRADDPLSPGLMTYRTLTVASTALAARTDRIAVGMGTSLHVYSLPLVANETPQTWTSPTAVSALAIKDSYVYVGTTASGIRVLSGLGGTLQHIATLSIPNSKVTELYITSSGTPLRLFASASGHSDDVTTDGVLEYSLQQPSSPGYIRTLLAGSSCYSVQCDQSASYVYTATTSSLSSADYDILSIRMSDGQLMNTAHHIPAGGPALGVLGQFLIVRPWAHQWQSLSLSNGIMTHAGDLVVGPAVSPKGQSWSGSFERWAILSDNHGVRLFSPSGVTNTFKRGDATGDGFVTSADYDRIFDYVFSEATPCGRYDSFDVNDNGSIDISDATYLSSYLSGTGPAPPPPFISAGVDPTSDSLTYTRPR